jgi:DNA polymerase-3 subunit alpha
VNASTFHQVHVHSDYSILDGTGFVEEYVDLAVENGMAYVAVTDHGMAGAWPSLMDTCEKRGVKPVYGVELYLNDYNKLVPEFSKLSDEMKAKVRRSDHMLVFAETQAGYANLIRLVSRAWESGYYYNPRVSWDELCELSDGLVATTGCLASPINRALAKESPGKVKELLREWDDVWKGKLWVEWQMIDVDDQDSNNPKLMRLAEDLGIPPIVTNDVHYAKPDHAYLQKVQLLVQSRGGTIKNPSGLVFDSTCHWYKNELEMDERWDAKYRDLMDCRDDFYERSKEETLRLCQRCGYVSPDRSSKLPVTEDAEERMAEECYSALPKLGIDDRAHRDRLKEELFLISKKGFSSYFLLQQEVIRGVRNAMKADIGPCRGSVGGCLSAHLMGITKIDPVKHDLLFSRFLSPSRGGRQMCLHV